MDRNEEIKKISELLYNEYISNGWKNVSTEGCERQAINYIDVRDLVKKLTLTDVSKSLNATYKKGDNVILDTGLKAEILGFKNNLAIVLDERGLKFYKQLHKIKHQ